MPMFIENPILDEGADPWLLWHQGLWYAMATGDDCLVMRRAKTINGLKAAPEIEIWRDAVPSRGRHFWAPEAFLLGGLWYLYYTASSGADGSHRVHVLKSEGPDPVGPYYYKAQWRTDPENQHFAIDGSVVQLEDERLYAFWAGAPGHVLFVSAMENPWTLQGERACLPAEGFGDHSVREGPALLRREGRVFLTYSIGDARSPDYKLGLLWAEEDAGLLDPAAWHQHPQPVLARSDAHSVYGPGHNVFFRSPDGTEDWMIYHAKDHDRFTYAGRAAWVQRVFWGDDGMPSFGVPARELPAPSGELERE